MFQRIDIHLQRPICEHLPTVDNSTWRAYFTIATDDKREKRVEMHVYCQICKKRVSVVQKNVPIQFMLRGKPAFEQESPFYVDECAQNADAVAERTGRVKHERNFTPFDRHVCKLLGIKYEGS